MNRKFLIFAFILCLFATSGGATTPENMTIQTLNHPELLDKQIYAVSARDGIKVWGLQNRIFIENMDGSTQTFSSSNSPIADGGTVSAVAVVNNDVWVTQTAPSQGLGILKYNFEKWESFIDPETHGMTNNTVVDIYVDPDENIWFGHRLQGLSRYIDQVNPTFKSYNKISHLYDCNLFCSFMQLTHLWIGTTNGIVRLRTEIKSNHELDVDKWLYPEFPAREAFSICDYLDDLLIAGTSRGLAIFDGKTWSILDKTKGIKALPAMHLLRSGKNIWIGSPVGLQLWNIDNPGQLITEADGLPSSNITALCLDENNNLLVGTEKGATIISLKTPKE